MLFGIEDHLTIDRNLALGFNTLLLRLIPGDLYSSCPNKQFLSVNSTFYIVRFYYQTHTLKPACQAGRQFVPLSLMVFGMIHPGHERHERPTC